MMMVLPDGVNEKVLLLMVLPDGLNESADM